MHRPPLRGPSLTTAALLLMLTLSTSLASAQENTPDRHVVTPDDARQQEIRDEFGPAFRVLRTEHLEVISDTSIRYHRVVTGVLEEFCRHWRERFFEAEWKRVTIYLYEKEKDLVPVVVERGLEHLAYTASFWVPDERAIYGRRDLGEGRFLPLGSLFHDVGRALLQSEFGRDLPPWISVGLGSLFETSWFARGTWRFGDANTFLLLPVRDAIAAKKLPSPRQLFEMRDSEFRRRIKLNAGASLVVFAFLKELGEERLDRFLEAFRDTRDARTALETATGWRMAKLTGKLRSSARRTSTAGAALAENDFAKVAKVERSNRDWPWLQYRFARHLKDSGNPKKALRHARYAEALPIEAHILTAELVEEDDPEAAIAALRTVAAEQPWRDTVLEEVHRDLARLLRTSGDHEAADEVEATLALLLDEDRRSEAPTGGGGVDATYAFGWKAPVEAEVREVVTAGDDSFEMNYRISVSPTAGGMHLAVRREGHEMGEEGEDAGPAAFLAMLASMPELTVDTKGEIVAVEDISLTMKRWAKEAGDEVPDYLMEIVTDDQVAAVIRKEVEWFWETLVGAWHGDFESGVKKDRYRFDIDGTGAIVERHCRHHGEPAGFAGNVRLTCAEKIDGDAAIRIVFGSSTRFFGQDFEMSEMIESCEVSRTSDVVTSPETLQPVWALSERVTAGKLRFGDDLGSAVKREYFIRWPGGEMPASGPAAPVPLPSAGALTDRQQWALAMCAMYTLVNGEELGILGGAPPSEAEKKANIDLLRNFWGDENREEFLGSFEWVTTEGHRVMYDTIRNTMKSWSPEVLRQFLAQMDAQSREQYRFVAEHDDELGDTGILAWDYCRSIALCGWGFMAGYITEEEAWDMIIPVAEEMAKTFDSWKAMSDNFLLGRRFWSGGEKNALSDRFREAVERLLEDETGPWRTLDFKTGERLRD